MAPVGSRKRSQRPTPKRTHKRSRQQSQKRSQKQAQGQSHKQAPKQSQQQADKVRAYLTKSDNPLKKFKVTVVHPDGRTKTMHFGGIKESGEKYQDYTMHKDETIMRRYLKRHRSRENWTKAGVDTKGFWARWLLWSEPSLSRAIARTESEFDIQIMRRAPPRRTS